MTRQNNKCKICSKTITDGSQGVMIVSGSLAKEGETIDATGHCDPFMFHLQCFHQVAGTGFDPGLQGHSSLPESTHPQLT